MAKVTGIGGVFFRASDPEKMSAWYEKHLGIPAGKPSEGTSFPWSPVGDPATQRMMVWAPFPRDTKYFGSSGQTFMINSIVDDIDGLIADLVAAGADADPKREDYPYGRFAWVTDAEGNRCELWEPTK